MKLNENFNQQEFIDWISGFLPDFSKDIRKVDVSKSFQGIKSIQTIGESPLGVRVYIIETEQDPSRRKIGLATESFTLLRDYGTPNAIIVYFSENSSLWRLSLLTSTLTWDEGKIKKKLSNPKRQSYVLGSKAKVKTPHQYLISKGSITDFADLKSRFSLEVVNKEFYKEISSAFIHLVGGQIANGKSKKTVEAQLKLPFVKDHSQTSQEFAVRLIGRIIFCWFLREKRSASGHSLMPRELLSFEASSTIEDYYHKILEPIFFEVLNKPIKTRKDAFVNDLFSAIPYLNGGLFSPHEDDFFNYNEGKQAVNHNMVVVPDGWLKSLFEVLETFNFTIDENTSFDEELSIDPEMLGRIFENLLAEINPETGESARKSTGSYYTPRVIVDYMVDESLYLFLKDKTNIPEEKLRSLISYDLEDDNSSPLNEEEKDKIAQALGSIKILDPACGSGAFPIGALQKIVFILQQIDQHGQLWFKKQIQNTPIELRKVIEREFQEKNFDYIRKLGIIRENIYGIDIQPIATEISRLRCFLTLVVDERIDDTLENRGIEPLPNLDFKFVTANTLVGLPTTAGSTTQVGLFEDNEGINELKEVRDMFFNASGFERDQLKLQFVQTQNKMFQKLISEGLRGHADMTAKLTTWDPFSHKSAGWFDPEWMFGIRQGFDIIIANPPYLTLSRGKGQHTFSKDQIDFLTQLYSDVKEYKNNLFTFFIRKSIALLKSYGIMTYIVPNAILYNASFSKIRKLMLSDTSLSTILDIKGSVFESAIIGGNCVLLLNNEVSREKNLIRTSIINENGDLKNIHYNYIDQLSFKKNDDYKYYLDLEKSKLYFKLEENSKKLGDLASLYNGIKTGDNKRFISDSQQNDMYRSVIRGRDFSRFSKLKPSVFVLFDKEKLWSNTNEGNLTKIPKILVRQTGDEIIATLDESGFMHMDTTHSIYDAKISLEYLLGILNSKLISWWHKALTSEDGRAFAEVKIVNLKKVPIRISDGITTSELCSIVFELLNNPQDEKLFQKLNAVVYKIYDLSSDEISLIENTK